MTFFPLQRLNYRKARVFFNFLPLIFEHQVLFSARQQELPANFLKFSKEDDDLVVLSGLAML
jgi:hypothetical protein